jgi:hypothetical protein
MEFKECLDYCEDVYKEKSKGKVIADARFHAKCSIVEMDSYKIITFRGTDSINNWINNLYIHSLVNYSLSNYFENIRFLPRHDLDGHQGFFKIAHRLYGKIKENIDKNDILKIYGHSLGGALATIIAYCLAYEGYNINVLITVGSPRVFRKGNVVTPENSFNEIINNYYRLMNEEDIVTFLPLHSKETTFINFDFENEEDISETTSSGGTQSSSDLYKLAVASASLLIGKKWLWNSILDKIFHNVKNFVHVGNGIILTPRKRIDIGIRDIGRDVGDINITIYYKYLSLIFSNQTINQIAISLGVGVGVGNFARIIEDLTSNTWILNFVRIFTFNWNIIGYEMTNNLFESDPFYQKLIRIYGNDPEIKPYLPLLDFERGRRRFFGKILPDYYKTVNGFIYTKLQSYKTFSDRTEEIKFKVVDEIMTDWINDDTMIIGKSKANAIQFYQLVRDNLLRKFVGNSKSRSGGLRNRLGFTGTNFGEQQTKTIIFASIISLIYFLVYSVIMYRMSYKGSYDHKLQTYRNNIKHLGTSSLTDDSNVEPIVDNAFKPPKILSFVYVDESEMGNVIFV